MPGSSKMKKNREQAANRAAGIGDAQGRLPSKVVVEAVIANCSICMQSCRMSKTNTDAKIHCQSRHPTATFAHCFPGQFDPTVAAVVDTTAAAAVVAAPVVVKPKPKADDLSFLDSALSGTKGKAGKK